MHRVGLLLALLLGLPWGVVGQRKQTDWLEGWPGGVARPAGRVARAATATDTAQALVAALQAAGFAAAQVVYDSLSRRYRTEAGPYYSLDSIGVVGLPAAALADVRRTGLRVPSPWQPALAEAYAQRCLAATGSHGYPYAVLSAPRVLYHSRTPDSVGVTVAYQVAPGPYTVWGLPQADSVLRERPRWLAAQLGLYPGTPFAWSDWQALGQRLAARGYYTLAAPPVPRDSAGVLSPQLRLKRVAANRFDALVGLLPPREAQTEWQLTALIDLRLVSALRLGERLTLGYEQFPGTSRRLNVRLEVPQVGGSRLGGELRLQLFKQDSTFQTLQFEPSVRYQVTPNLSAELFSQVRTSGLLRVAPFQATVFPPPPVLDSRAAYTGVGLRYDSRDDPQNPRSGQLIALRYGLGTKTVRRTVGLDSLDYSRLALNQTQQELRLQAETYLPSGRAQVWRLGLQGYWLGLREYFDSDLQPFGGLRTLRGFNENQFLLSAYAVATVEYRLLLGDAAYLGLFADYGYLEQRSFTARTQFRPGSGGFSLSLDTQAGQLQVVYAVGQTSGQPLQLGRGRVHIGYAAGF